MVDFMSTRGKLGNLEAPTFAKYSSQIRSFISIAVSRKLKSFLGTQHATLIYLFLKEDGTGQESAG